MKFFKLKFLPEIISSDKKFIHKIMFSDSNENHICLSKSIFHLSIGKTVQYIRCSIIILCKVLNLNICIFFQKGNIRFFIRSKVFSGRNAVTKNNNFLYMFAVCSKQSALKGKSHDSRRNSSKNFYIFFSHHINPPF